MKDTLKRVSNRILFLILSLFIALGLAATPFAAQDAHADSKPYMKTLKVKWDLKKGRAKTVTEKYAAVGKKKHALKITNVKVRKSKVEGYKQVSFTFIDTRKWSPTKNQVHKIVNSEFTTVEEHIGGGGYFAIVDYYTGKCLEGENDLGVTVEFSPWDHKGQRKYYDKHGCWVNLAKYSVCRVVVTYPKNYKGLCVGVGGDNALYGSAADDEFWEGEKPFGKTTYYKKGKANSHWMRIK